MLIQKKHTSGVLFFDKYFCMFKKILILIFLFPLTANAEYILSPLQEHQILLGHTCCYNQEVIQYVRYKNLPTVNIQESEFTVPIYIPGSGLLEPADNWMWALFFGLQLADIYSTNRGVKYDCISEANPLLPSVPTVAEMATLKAVILIPSYDAIGWDNITRADLILPIVFATGVVSHNLRLVDKAERRCNLR